MPFLFEGYFLNYLFVFMYLVIKFLYFWVLSNGTLFASWHIQINCFSVLHFTLFEMSQIPKFLDGTQLEKNLE